MSREKTVNVQGVSFTTLLAVLFIALKLTGVVAWSWWWVLAPIWIPIMLVLLFLLILSMWVCWR